VHIIIYNYKFFVVLYVYSSILNAVDRYFGN